MKACRFGGTGSTIMGACIIAMSAKLNEVFTQCRPSSRNTHRPSNSPPPSHPQVKLRQHQVHTMPADQRGRGRPWGRWGQGFMGSKGQSVIQGGRHSVFFFLASGYFTGTPAVQPPALPQPLIAPSPSGPHRFQRVRWAVSHGMVVFCRLDLPRWGRG